MKVYVIREDTSVDQCFCSLVIFSTMDLALAYDREQRIAEFKQVNPDSPLGREGIDAWLARMTGPEMVDIIEVDAEVTARSVGKQVG